MSARRADPSTSRSAAKRRRSADPTDPADDAAGLAAALRVSATRLSRRLRQQADAGLSPSQLAALTTVERHGPLTLGALAEHERVAPPTVTKVVGKLEADGWVSRRSDPTDRRVAHVEITPAGQDLLAESRRRKTAWLSGRIAGLDLDQRRRLADALDVIDALLDDEPPSPQDRP